MSAADWTSVSNVLAIRLDALGDVLMTTPALRAFKESRPGRRVTLLTSPAGAAVATLIPEVDEVIVYESPWMKATAPRPDSRADRALVERLRLARFDAAAIFTVYSQNPLPAALFAYLADIPRRLAHCRENPYQLLTTWVREPEPEKLIRHEVRRQLDLVATVGCRTANEQLSLRVPPAARRYARQLLEAILFRRAGRWAIIHPGASAPSRRYPPEGFAEVADRMAREHDCAIVFTGGAAERELVDHVRGLMTEPSYSLAGEMDVAAFAALIAEAPVLIANNSGPVHIAAAVGTPVVDLYALTNPQHTPWGVPCRVLNHDVPCKYCYRSVCPEQHQDCLRRVPPEAVVRAAGELMGLVRSEPPMRRELTTVSEEI